MLTGRSETLLFFKKKNGRVFKFNWFFLKPHKIVYSAVLLYSLSICLYFILQSSMNLPSQRIHKPYIFMSHFTSHSLFYMHLTDTPKIHSASFSIYLIMRGLLRLFIKCFYERWYICKMVPFQIIFHDKIFTDSSKTSAQQLNQPALSF